MAAFYLLAEETVQNQQQQHLDTGTVQVLHLAPSAARCLLGKT
jgi:hypothetical protein